MNNQQQNISDSQGSQQNSLECRNQSSESEQELEDDIIPQQNYQCLTIRKVGYQNLKQIGSQYQLKTYKKSCLQQNSLISKLRKENKVKLIICVTMYNEESAEIKRTMKGVNKNIQQMIEQKQINDVQNEVLVLLIADGLQKVKKNVKEYLSKKGVYDEDTLKLKDFYEYNKKDQQQHPKSILFQKFDAKNRRIRDLDKQYLHENNVLHCFSSTSIKNFGTQNTDKKDFDPENNQPFPFMFVAKHHNGGKLNSHLFFFRGFCEYLKPKYAVLIDVGTQPQQNAIGILYEHMEYDNNCGGACGQIQIDTSTATFSTFLQIFAQYFEYKISNFLDKAAENLFGFISVLPGAFSIFRMEAIQGKPLTQYFKGLDKDNISCFQSNMYLAQD